jgi:ATP-dependent protease ClpP protease subunit
MTLRVNKNTGEIFLYGVVGDSWGEDSFTDTDVLMALDKLDGKRAIARINSPGGIADQGISIYNMLKRYAPGVDTVVDAVAASAASVIALAGDKRTTSAGGRWMIHRALALSVGNANELRKVADTLETYDKSLVEIYSKYLPGTPDAIMQLLTDETWYTGETAMASGLSTGMGEESMAEPMVAAWFRNAPAALMIRVKNRGQVAAVKAKALGLAR